MLRILFLGDVVGRNARQMIFKHMEGWRKRHALDFVIVNGENAAGGFGITPAIAQQFFESGVDVVSTGNHIWSESSIIATLDNEPRLLRPLNYPAHMPGRGAHLYLSGERRILVANVMGQVFMESVDDPFAAIDQVLTACPLGQEADAIIVDIHAEASSEKMAMGYFCDGRASLVVGTHTHVPTHDGRILEGGTAYQTDAGMCGDYKSIIGMEKDEPLRRFIDKSRTSRLTPARDTPTICGVIVETAASGLAQSIMPFREGAEFNRKIQSKD